MTTEVRAPAVPIYLAGEFVEAGTPLQVRNPASGELGLPQRSAPSTVPAAPAA